LQRRTGEHCFVFVQLWEGRKERLTTRKLAAGQGRSRDGCEAGRGGDAGGGVSARVSILEGREGGNGWEEETIPKVKLKAGATLVVAAPQE
jgi:hypothetical protein